MQKWMTFSTGYSHILFLSSVHQDLFRSVHSWFLRFVIVTRKREERHILMCDSFGISNVYSNMYIQAFSFPLLFLFANVKKVNEWTWFITLLPLTPHLLHFTLKNVLCNNGSISKKKGITVTWRFPYTFIICGHNI